MRRDPITKVKKINYINTNEPMQIDLIRQVIAETGSRLQRVLLLYDSQRLELAKKLIFLLKRPISVINLIYLFSDGTCLLLVRLPYSMLPSSIICIQYVSVKKSEVNTFYSGRTLSMHLGCKFCKSTFVMRFTDCKEQACIFATQQNYFCFFNIC